MDDIDGSGWRRVDVVAETGSTNADLLARAASGEDIDGVVLIARHQSAGRGRHGRQWSAPPGTQLSMSVEVAVAGVAAAAWGWLPLAAGVAVVDAVSETTGVRAGLKWPNDVLVGDRKLAGILAEVAGPAIVVGLGLNTTMASADLPDPRATSLAVLGAVTETGEPGDAAGVDAVRVAVLRHLRERIGQWRAGPAEARALADDYRCRSITLGSRVRASLPGGATLDGEAVAVDDHGRLAIDTGDGVHPVSAGDITHLRPLAT